MSRTFFSLRGRRGFGSRHPAPLTREDASVVLCPGLLHLSSCIFVRSDDADRVLKLASRVVVRCAAALAAGETPSPEMVAASGETEGLRPVVAWALLAGVIVSVITVILLSAQSMLYRRVPLDKPPEALAERARDILQSVGYSELPVDTAMGFYEGTSFLRYIAEHDKSKTRWNDLETGAFVFWYRGSPRPMASSNIFSVAPGLGVLWTDDPRWMCPG